MITITNGLTAPEEIKNLYNDLMMNVFGFSFEEWFAQNQWGQDYEIYSIIEEGTMISNASAYKVKLLINGQQQDFIQIGAVATRKEHEGKGLAKKIIEHIFSIYPNTPCFLFANDTVLEFYPKFGFRSIRDRQPYIKYNLEKQGEMIKLEPNDPKVDEYLRGRTQFSKRFDCINQYPINWFHIINGFNNHIYEIPQLNAMLVAVQSNNTLKIFDILTKEPLCFSELVPHLHFEGVDTIEFGFNPDWMNFDYLMKDYKLENCTLFIKGDFEVEEGYIVPRLMRT